PKWYCLRSHPKREHFAAANLRQIEGVECYCPRIRLQRSTRRGLAWFTEALFPNYLFARFNLREMHAQIRHCKSVAGILRFGERYPEVADSAIEDLRSVMHDNELRTVEYAVAEGDDVDIVSGPLRGSTGTVTRVLPARERVKVLLEFLGGQ